MKSSLIFLGSFFVIASLITGIIAYKIDNVWLKKDIQSLQESQRKNRRKIGFVKFDKPKYYLVNLGHPLFLLVADGIMLPLMLGSLIYGEVYEGIWPFVFMIIAGFIVASWFISRPPNPFGDNGLSNRTLDQLEISERKVLTFFRSRTGKKIILSISGLFALLIFLFGMISGSFSKNLTGPYPSGYWSGCFISGFGGLFVILGNQMTILFLYTLKHWDSIQQEYDPWPVDRPYSAFTLFSPEKIKDKK